MCTFTVIITLPGERILKPSRGSKKLLGGRYRFLKEKPTATEILVIRLFTPSKSFRVPQYSIKKKTFLLTKPIYCYILVNQLGEKK